MRRPAILLFVSGQDPSICCASNYERFIFRDKRVVDLAKEAFMVVRVDRGGLSKDQLEAWKLQRGRPALLITDSEGLIAARWDACTSANVVHAAMVQTIKRSRVKTKASQEARKVFSEVEQLLGAGSYRDARSRLEKLARDKDGPVGGRHRAELMLASLTVKARELMSEAEGVLDPVGRYAKLLGLQEEFWHDEAVIGEIKTRVKSLQDAPETAEPVREYRAGRELEKAEALLAKKPGPGREALRELQREWPGTAAAKRAEELLQQK